MSKPENAPLGAKPTLPAPAAGKPAEKAAHLFARYLSDVKDSRDPKRGRTEGPAAAAVAHPTAGLAAAAGARSAPEPPAGGRSYGLALAAAYSTATAPADVLPEDPSPGAQEELSPGAQEELSPGTQEELSPGVQGELSPSGGASSVVAAAATATPSRPPPGAPTVRPSARRRVEASAPRTKEELTGAAQNLQLITGPDGSTAFEISISDELFQELTCRITWREGRLLAAFRVADANLRRLLEAESGRLRARLEERGLKVEEIVVLSESSPDP